MTIVVQLTLLRSHILHYHTPTTPQFVCYAFAFPSWLIVVVIYGFCTIPQFPYVWTG